MASYIGVAPPEQTGIVERYKYAGDGSTTAFSGADTNSKTLRYTSTNPVLVFLNGVQLVEGTDPTPINKLHLEMCLLKHFLSSSMLRH